MNVNYRSDDNKNQIHWKIDTSRNQHVHFTNTENNTFERNRKSNEILVKLSTRFSSQHNDNQNITTKIPASAIPNIPEKTPANSRKTSPHVTNIVRNKRPPVCTTDNYLKNFIPITIPGNSEYGGIVKNCHKILVAGDSLQ